MSETKRGFDGRVLSGLLLLNLVVHFVPFERPGFQPDDFFFLHRARIGPEWSFVEVSLAQATRPLGFLLFILIPKLLGLSEPSQLMVLVATTTLLTALVCFLLADLLPRPLSSLAGLAFVVWPVKHELYASQLFGVNTLAGALIVGSALLYRRWTRTSQGLALVLAVASYGLSIFTYEIGYFAPLVFVLIDRPPRARSWGPALFLLPALLYWVFRATHGDVPIGGGLYPVSPGLLAANLLTSLPSNLFGFQVVRNVGYGLWGVLNGPAWFQLGCGVTALVVGALSARWILEAARSPDARDLFGSRVGGGLLAAGLLAAPAAMVLVESRHSVLAAVPMGVVVAALVVRLKPLMGTALVLTLLLSCEGLALRQAEASRLQAAVYDVVKKHRDEIRSASSVVFDVHSLARRVSYTWGEKKINVLRGYWGINAFSANGLENMVEDALYENESARIPMVRTCSDGLVVSAMTVVCARDYASQRPFAVARAGTLIIDFGSMTLP